MKFPIAGTVTGGIRMMELQQKWQLRKENLSAPKQKTTQENGILERMRREAEATRKSNETNAIYSKLKSGMLLTPKELDYLRENSPDLYEKAMKAAREREAYKKALEQCTSKEEVQNLNLSKLNSFCNEAKSIMGNAALPQDKKLELMEELQIRLANVQNEHLTFLNTPEYKALPDKKDDDKESKTHKEETLNAETLAQELSRLLSELRHSENPMHSGSTAAAKAEKSTPADGQTAPSNTDEARDGGASLNENAIATDGAQSVQSPANHPATPAIYTARGTVVPHSKGAAVSAQSAPASPVPRSFSGKA